MLIMPRAHLVPLLALFLGLALFISLFQVVHAQDNRTVLNYWLWLDDATDPTWEELVEEFNSTHPDIEVRYELVPLAQYYDRMLTALTAGTPPDAARFKEWWLGEFITEELLTPLEAYIGNWEGADDVVHEFDHFYRRP